MVCHSDAMKPDAIVTSSQKIKALSRSTSSYQAPGSDVARQPRNLDPALHPFERAREYTRALNATKMERMFAAPFVAQMGRGHVDGVYTLARDPRSLDRLASGSGDGVLKVWDLPSRDEVWQKPAHTGLIKGMCWTQDRKLLSCGTDRTVKLFNPYDPEDHENAPPVGTWLGSNSFNALSIHRSEPAFAAASMSSIQLYDISRPSSTPTQSLAWPTSIDTINALSFNQSETSLLASCANDRSIVLYDLRTNSPLHRSILSMSSNSIAWNPMEPFNFAVGNEDHNIYLFDARNLTRALNVLKDHVSAVMCVDFSPTGQDVVSASYDRTIRLWTPQTNGHSRDVYHTKRMQRVFSCTFTGDNTYLLSGSDDGNIRLWRSNASARSGIKSARQRQKLEYDAALKERWKHMPEIKRISRHRHVPKVITKAGQIKSEELKSIKRREENERKHSKKRDTKRRSEREKMILTTEQ